MDSFEIIALSRAKIGLPERGLIKLREGAGWLVACHRGRLWITQENDVRDIIVEAGEPFVIERRGLALISALSLASVELIESIPLAQHKIVQES